jgi:O-antigen ligase
MTLPPIWRTRLYGTAATVLALLVGFEIAQEEMVLPWVCAAGLGATLFVRFNSLPGTTVLLGLTLAGYIVGNRGFAQLYLSGSFPLLPAEGVLAVGCLVLLVQGAWRRELPFRRDPLNFCLLLWLAIGGARLLADFRTSGFVALRDSAMVYYGLFFFLAQDSSRDPAGRRWLRRILLASCAVLPFTSALLERFPDFFYEHLAVRGVPLLFYKGDLLGTFLAVGSLLCFLRYEEQRRPWAAVLSLLLAAACLATNSRASMLGLAVGAGWLALGGRWRFAVALGGGGIVAAIAILLAARATGTPWQQTAVYGMYEKVVSIADPQGVHNYSGEDTANKGDNNIFRTTWWRIVIAETTAANPLVGLGFGYNLAESFVREYYPDASDDLTARSPHNFLITLFARLGIAGLLPFLGVLGCMAIGTWRALREGDTDRMGCWCSAWVILVSACFGVVLEGPMGAVVFWTLLGLAHARAEPVPSPDGPETVAHLPGAGDAAGVAPPP